MGHAGYRSTEQWATSVKRATKDEPQLVWLYLLFENKQDKLCSDEHGVCPSLLPYRDGWMDGLFDVIPNFRYHGNNRPVYGKFQ